MESEFLDTKEFENKNWRVEIWREKQIWRKFVLQRVKTWGLGDIESGVWRYT